MSYWKKWGDGFPHCTLCSFRNHNITDLNSVLNKLASGSQKKRWVINKRNNNKTHQNVKDLMIWYFNSNMIEILRNQMRNEGFNVTDGRLHFTLGYHNGINNQMGYDILNGIRESENFKLVIAEKQPNRVVKWKKKTYELYDR